MKEAPSDELLDDYQDLASPIMEILTSLSCQFILTLSGQF